VKILVAIASYGTNNDAYLQRLLQEYATMPYEIDVVVVSNVRKALGPNVEVVVGLPSSNPWSLPFAHKSIFVERANDYDLFIYSEDDTLITQANIEAFLWATSVLHPDEIAGFLRSEQGPDGTLYYCTIHSHYHWDVRSVCSRQGDTFAHFTNEHGACYVLTREQLKTAIASGGFSVPPHEGKYDLLVTAATDPYTQCGFKKLVCVSRLAQFTCKHLTNKYIGRTGIRADLVDLQVKALLEIDDSRVPEATAIRVETRLPGTRWMKSYYEPCQDVLVSMLPSSAHKVLSIGCGWGSTEEALVKRNIEVAAVPLDSVIGRLATARGVRLVPYAIEAAPSRLAGESFDAILISNLIHLVDSPVELLRSYRALLNPGGVVIASFPNLKHASVLWRRLRQAPEVRGLADYGRSGVHVTSLSLVTEWLRSAGFHVERTGQDISGRWAHYHRTTLGLLSSFWAYDYSVAARATAP
jgi:2-polyprenyl-3-methyl-5-hydroxy-6-metoxy-1,4-benzoquinol methylase